MNLEDMGELLELSIEPNDKRTKVNGITEDSRRVLPGMVFVAVQGEHTDGHTYASKAIEQGAVAVLGNRQDIESISGKPYIYCSRPRYALGVLAHHLAGNPSQSMTVVGVTGTNGKSSTVRLVHHILSHTGRRCAALGTLGYEIGNETLPALHTTPFAEDLANVFKRAENNGCACTVMEVSSHALEQDRVAGIDFDAAAFTNLTQDHLDYHKDMTSYLRAKLRLFECISPGSDHFTVINREDPSADAFIKASQVRCYTYGRDGDCTAEDIRLETHRSRFMVCSPWGTAPVEMRLLGRHNISNALCALMICHGLGLPLDLAADALAFMPSVPGRFEHVDAGQPFQVIVDYAHTDDGLRNVLNAARSICSGAIITVFGCGGDRDRGKRPKMARVAAELSDFSIITSDNPRTENPLCILDDIEAGMKETGMVFGKDYLRIENRADAIECAIRKASPGDLVLIAGKGHEDYQIIGEQRIHFDDREAARAALIRVLETERNF